jgi:hypothetical protein
MDTRTVIPISTMMHYKKIMVMIAATTKHVQDQAMRHSTRRTITAAVMRTSDRGNSSSSDGELAPQ